MPSWGEFPGPGSSAVNEALSALSALTQNSGAIGGSPNGDMADLDPTPAIGDVGQAAQEVAQKLNELLAALQS